MNINMPTNPPIAGRFAVRVPPYVMSIALGLLMLAVQKGGLYRPPNYGGFEPKFTQDAAVEIVHTGRTTMTYHPTGYSYLVALVYLLLPPLPLSMQFAQIASLPLVVWGVGRIAGSFGGAGCRNWGEWCAGLYYPFGYCATTFNSVYATFLFATLAIAALLPLLGLGEQAKRSLGRSLLVGFLLGIVACVRPNYSLLGVIFAVALWRSTRSLWEAVVRSVPIAAVSLGLLLAMTALNPPEPGQFVRGSQAMNGSLLKGTYEYTHTWWDWDWSWARSDPGYQDYRSHLDRIEAETGKPYTDPASQAVVAREAWKRILGLPGNTLKKMLISTVRVWILIPTQLHSMPVKVAIALQEFLLLGLALAGLVGLWGERGLFLLAAGVMLVPTVEHWFLHVEPRYSLPARGVELALAAVTVAGIWRRLRAPNASIESNAPSSPSRLATTPGTS